MPSLCNVGDETTANDDTERSTEKMTKKLQIAEKRLSLQHFSLNIVQRNSYNKSQRYIIDQRR